MELSKTYADGSVVAKTYDAYNRPVSFSDNESNAVEKCASMNLVVPVGHNLVAASSRYLVYTAVRAADNFTKQHGLISLLAPSSLKLRRDRYAPDYHISPAQARVYKFGEPMARRS